jgi:hypothetical protein
MIKNGIDQHRDEHEWNSWKHDEERTEKPPEKKN